MSKLLRRLSNYLPQSLVGRVYALYSATLLFFVGFGLALFYQYQYTQALEDVQQSATMLVELAAQTISESAVIGDYDTIKRTLEKTTLRSHFVSATYIDLSGGAMVARSEQHPAIVPPEWLVNKLAEQLYDVNRVINAGGRDYGVLRLGFAVDEIASGLWLLLRGALLLALVAFCGGLAVIWFPLRRWLGALDRAPLFEQGGTPDGAANIEQLFDELPREFKPMFQKLNETAANLRSELATREKALVALREVLAGLRALPEIHFDGSGGDLAEISSLIARLVAEREASHEALEKARDAAEAANRIKSQFLANMSHEIRTPMNGIIGMTGLALDGELSDDQRENLRMVKSSAESLMTIINDILDFSKMEADKLSIESIAFDLPSMVRETSQMISLRAEEKGLQLNCEFGSAIPAAIEGDPVRLRQVLLNLLSNAIKFTERGGVDLILHREGDWLHFVIRDTGIGIAPDKQAHVFEAFSQEDASTTRKYGGTGLGLSISRRLVELMGGRMWLDSVPGQGSCFHFVIPCCIASLPASPVMTLTPAPQAHPKQESGQSKAHLLLVEDNPVNQKLALTLLQRRGYEVSLAVNGEDAVQVSGSEAFDAILMDIQMPVMGGIEAAQQIRAREAATGGRRVPIIAMTANAMQGDREACVEAGMDDYLSKPIHAADLFATLGRWLAQ